MRQEQFPILEFDPARTAFIEPSNFIQPIDISEHCVITFFREVINKLMQAGELKQVACLYSETVDIPIYETVIDGKRICLVQGFVGAAGSAAFLEELIAYGIKKFIVCGGAGVLQKNIVVGHLMIPTSAIRDEGVSYHYFEPSREIESDPEVIAVIENYFRRHGIEYLKTKTWTTDSFYRETKDKVALRASEGCLSVEMEAAAFFAVSRFRNIRLGQVLYGGDDLSGVNWDSRSWQSREMIRENLVDISLRICLEL